MWARFEAIAFTSAPIYLLQIYSLAIMLWIREKYLDAIEEELPLGLHPHSHARQVY